MSTAHLPANPHLDALRGEARRLQRAAREGDADAVSRVARHHPQAVPDAARLPLSVAQLVVARTYGFSSWPRLRRHIEVLHAHTWVPDAPAADEPPEHRFARLACLDYDTDDVAHRQAAAAMIVTDPDLPDRDVWAAAAASRPDLLERMLRTDPALARTRGGPHGWSPLFHLVYSRLTPAPPRDDVLRCARALLAAGADPHEGYFWRGLGTPFTLLTGVFGEGERGPVAQPRHPWSTDLAELLLDAGTDPNDGQALYNRMFGTDDDHLRLLLHRGLGRGSGGPWRLLLGDGAQGPRELVAGQLAWAVVHDHVDRVRLLIEYGADLDTPFEDGRTPAATAALHGHTQVLDLLLAAGSAQPRLDPSDAFVGAVMRGDEAAAEDMARAGTAPSGGPTLLVWAAGRGNTAAVRILLDLGADVDAPGRADTYAPGRWETALHAAVQADREDLVALLLDHGADATVVDARFGATPLGWAEHLGRPGVARLLRERGIGA